MLVCPSCNAEYESGKFCKKCGTRLLSDDVVCECPICENNISLNMSQCSRCGFDISILNNPYQYVYNAAIIDWSKIGWWFSKKHDDERAFFCYKRGSEFYQDKAIWELGRCYYYGIGTEVDYVNAFYYFERTNNFRGMGECYEFGRGVGIDYYKAIENYEQKSGFCKANVSGSYDPEVDMGISRCYLKLGEYRKCLSWLNKIHNNSHAKFYLGYCYENGYGCARNIEIAKNYYEEVNDFINNYCIGIDWWFDDEFMLSLADNSQLFKEIRNN